MIDPILIKLQQPELSKEAHVLKDLEEQTSSINKKLDNAQLKRHRIQVYIASCDGTAPPDLPSHLQGKTLGSPITPLSVDEAPQDSRIVLDTIDPIGWGKGKPPTLTSLPSAPDAASLIKPICTVKVLYDFEATPNSQEMSVSAGDVVDVIDKQDDG